MAAVLVFHVGEVWQGAMHSAAGHAMAKVAEMGWCGVDLFFVLSGYLITGILMDTRGRRGYFQSFYARRTLRIFPLYYAYLAGLVLCAWWVWPGVESWREVTTHLGWYAAYLTNWRFAARGYPALQAVQHLWSLAIEEQFYLLWPAVVAFIAPRRLRAVVLGTVVFVWVLRVVLLSRGMAPVPIYVGTITRLDSLLLGALLAVTIRGDVVASVIKSRALLTMAIAAAGLVGLVLWRHGLVAGDFWIQAVGLSFLALLFTAVVALTVTNGLPAPVAALVSVGVLRRFGKVSYGAYVLHLPITIAVRDYWIGPAGIPDVATFVGALVLTTAATWAAAELSFRYFEAPLLALKSRFPRPT